MKKLFRNISIMFSLLLFTFGTVYVSNKKNHGAKVVNANNGIKNFRNAGPGVWAKASIGTLWDPATFYYNPSGFYSN